MATVARSIEENAFFKKITFYKNKHVTKYIKLFFIYSIMSVNRVAKKQLKCVI